MKNQSKRTTYIDPNATPKKTQKNKGKALTAISLVCVIIGVSIFGYIGVEKLVIEPQQAEETQTQVTELQKEFENPTDETVVENVNPENQDNPDLAGTPIPDRVGLYEELGLLYIPAFGTDYSALITAGDDGSEIHGGATGVNYYPDAAMPGEFGNFTLAGHRGYNGLGRFENIKNLNPGDVAYFETAAGWYKYSVTGSEVVMAEQVEVLLPVPHEPETKATKSIMTMTSCYYDGLTKKRIAVYADLVDFIPRSEGKPADLG